jgi:hypothetical protein
VRRQAFDDWPGSFVREQERGRRVRRDGCAELLYSYLRVCACDGDDEILASGIDRNQRQTRWLRENRPAVREVDTFIAKLGAAGAAVGVIAERSNEADLRA